MTHIVVIGSGVAGMTAALDAVGRRGVRVTLITKDALENSNTWYAQGGIAVVSAPDDTVESHVADTLVAGAGLSDDEAVQVLCAEGPEAVQHLVDRGVLFDVHNGQLARGLEAAHSHQRILHAGGDATGAAIAAALISRVEDSNISVREHTMATDVVVVDGRVVGIDLLDGTRLDADAVVIATGGAGQLYPYTTNPDLATGDGIAMALRAGAVCADLEFYQFHPTSLAVPGNPLVSEAVRGEGAVLIDRDGERFMLDVHPDAELAPRDVVARGCANQMARQDGQPVRLDATALGTDFLAQRFPTIDATVKAHGFDWGSEPIPVTPAAHYFMGGIRTDLWARTSVPGLFAVGEAACTGLHGANRLASNSLLEGAVYGRRVVDAILDPDQVGQIEEFDAEWSEPVPIVLDGQGLAMERSDLQALMWRAAGLSRDEQSLAEAEHTIEQSSLPQVRDEKSAEDANLRVLAQAVLASALARRESRGGHFRSDYPEADPTLAQHSAVVVAARSGGVDA